MDFDSIEDVGTPPVQASAVPASTPQQPSVAGSSPSEPNFDDIQDVGQAMYGSPKEKIKTGIEGVAQGFAGPLATGVEKLFGARDSDIRGREETNPGIHQAGEAAGLVGGLLTGTGEAGVAEHLGQAGMNAVGLAKAAPDLSLIGKVTSATGKAAIENMVIGAGDETSKWLVNDPDQTAQSAMANVGLAGAIGGGIGGALGSVSPIWQATAGTKMGTLIDDFSNRMKFRTETPNLTDHLTETLQNAHDSIDQGSKMLYEKGGLKEQEIRRLLPEDASKAFDTAGGISDDAQKAIAKLRVDEAPARIVNNMSEAVGRFDTNVLKASESKDPFLMHDAINTFKQEMQSLSKYEKGSFPNAGEADAMNKVRDFAGKLKSNLEDESLWGKAASVQKDVNAAYSELQGSKGPLAQLRSKFMTNINGEMRVDPAKIDTYMNQAGNNKSAVKKQIVDNFLQGHDQFHEVLDKIHGGAGVQNPLSRAPIGALRDTTAKLSPGAQLADYMYDKGLSHTAGAVAGAATGDMVGRLAGLPEGISALIGEHALSPVFSKVLPLIAKPFATMATNATAGKAAIDYATAAVKGDQLINKAAKAVFKSERMLLPQQVTPDSKSRAKLEARLKTTQGDPESYANVSGKIGNYLPDHATSIASTSSNAVNYLNSLRPATDPASPLDSKPVVSPVEKAAYNRALDIAESPVLVLKHIKDGTLQPSDVIALKTMYPALYTKFGALLTSNMTDTLAKGGSIPYKTRIGMSMFTAQPLDSTMQPQNIMAAQLTSQSGQQAMKPQQGALKPSQSGAKGLSKLAENAQTADQNREQSRQVKS
jgi:hypothetical protein